MITAFIALIITITGEVLRIKGSNDLTYNTQDALSRIDQDVQRAIEFKTASYTPTSPQGQGDNATAFDISSQATTYLVLRTVTTDKNPLAEDRQLIYQMSGSNCSTTPYTMDVVYFTKVANGVTSLWRRVIQGSTADAGTPCTGTTPWQVPTCSPGYTDTATCKADDTLMLDNVGTLAVNFVNATGAQITNLASVSMAKYVNVSINTSKNVAGQSVSYNGNVRSAAMSDGSNSILPSSLELVAGDEHHSCSIVGSQTYCWGYNYYRELGDGTTNQTTTPVLVSQGAIPTGVTLIDIAAAKYHTCAVGSDGRAYCWGRNEQGSATGSTTATVVPQGAVPASVKILDIDAATYTTCAIGSDGKGYCWGENGQGQLGDGTTTGASAPVKVSQGAVPTSVKFLDIATSSLASCAVGSDGKGYCWGYNTAGQLGNGTTTSSSVPVAVSQGAIPAGVTLTSIAAASTNFCAIGSDGKGYCWGENYTGPLGNGTTTSSSVPVAVSQGAIPAGVTLKSIGAGKSNGHVCAIGSDGKGYCWGGDTYGQLGNGVTTTSYTTPVAVSQGAVPAGVTLKSIGLGLYHSCVLGSNTKVYCWGDNTYSQLGNGTATSSSIPVAVSNLP